MATRPASSKTAARTTNSKSPSDRSCSVVRLPQVSSLRQGTPQDSQSHQCRQLPAQRVWLPSPFRRRSLAPHQRRRHHHQPWPPQAASTSTCPALASHYSTGTLAGAIVGIGLPLLIAFLTALVFLLRERRKNKALLSQQSHSQSQDTKMATQTSHLYPQEMEHKPHAGLDGSTGRTEMESTGRVELPGGDGGGSYGRPY